MYDVAIVGGGPAGLNAGLILSRARRKVIIIDSGEQRNLRSHGIHGYLTRDGILPADFLQKGRDEVSSYGTELIKGFVVDADFRNNSFILTLAGKKEIAARKILIATGIKDNLPPIPGIDKLYGKSVFHCPYCDGWESRDKKIAVYANSKAAYALSLSLKTWSDTVFICSDGPHRLRANDKKTLDIFEIKIYTEKIKCLNSNDAVLTGIEFNNGEVAEADVLFFSSPQYQKSVLAEKLGCRINNKGYVLFGKNQSTNIKGVFIAGDAANDLKFVIVAAAEGAKAGIAINKELQEEEIKTKVRNKFKE